MNTLDWSAIWLEYYRPIAIYIYCRTKNWALAEDLASETFLKALKADREGRSPNISIRGWLYCVARNLMIDAYRHHHRDPTLNIDLEMVDELLPISRYASLEEHGVKVDMLGRLERAAEGLSDQQQAVIALRYGDGYGCKEISVLLGKPEGAIRSSQHLALDHLRNCVSE